MRRTSGFTLLELLVVLGIMGLMVSIAIPFAAATVERARLRANARELVNTLRQLQRDAMLDQRMIAVSSVPIEPLPGAASVGQATRWARVPSGAMPIVFYPDGTSSGGALHLVEGGQAVDVEVEWLTGTATARASR